MNLAGCVVCGWWLKKKLGHVDAHGRHLDTPAHRQRQQGCGWRQTPANASGCRALVGDHAAFCGGKRDHAGDATAPAGRLRDDSGSEDDSGCGCGHSRARSLRGGFSASRARDPAARAKGLSGWQRTAHRAVPTCNDARAHWGKPGVEQDQQATRVARVEIDLC